MAGEKFLLTFWSVWHISFWLSSHSVCVAHAFSAAGLHDGASDFCSEPQFKAQVATIWFTKETTCFPQERRALSMVLIPSRRRKTPLEWVLAGVPARGDDTVAFWCVTDLIWDELLYFEVKSWLICCFYRFFFFFFYMALTLNSAFFSSACYPHLVKKRHGKIITEQRGNLLFL